MSGEENNNVEIKLNLEDDIHISQSIYDTALKQKDFCNKIFETKINESYYYNFINNGSLELVDFVNAIENIERENRETEKIVEELKDRIIKVENENIVLEKILKISASKENN